MYTFDILWRRSKLALQVPVSHLMSRESMREYDDLCDNEKGVTLPSCKVIESGFYITRISSLTDDVTVFTAYIGERANSQDCTKGKFDLRERVSY
jgi:hypothetical protein